VKKYIREPFPALSHLFGAGISVLALISLIQNSGDNARAIFSSFVYGMSLILLYTASALTHGIHCSSKMMARFERWDHAGIFFLIAGTYTPVCLLIIPGSLGWMLLFCEWVLAFAGVYTVFFRPNISRTIRVIIYLAMGWLLLFALNPIIEAVSNTLLSWLIAGGLFYSIGSIFFLTNKPNLWPGKFTAHDLWHLFVLFGSISHFIFITKFLKTLL
jgi:hemolysin III